jgi:hypothetical protein
VQDDNYDDAVPLEPDHGSTTVWSDDDEKNVKLLLERYGGDFNESIKAFFRAGGTEYLDARRLSVRFAGRFGLTPIEFMKKYRRWRKGKPL